jgi:hypothetical protein
MKQIKIPNIQHSFSKLTNLIKKDKKPKNYRSKSSFQIRPKPPPQRTLKNVDRKPQKRFKCIKQQIIARKDSRPEVLSGGQNEDF